MIRLRGAPAATPDGYGRTAQRAPRAPLAETSQLAGSPTHNFNFPFRSGVLVPIGRCGIPLSHAYFFPGFLRPFRTGQIPGLLEKKIWRRLQPLGPEPPPGPAGAVVGGLGWPVRGGRGTVVCVPVPRAAYRGHSRTRAPPTPRKRHMPTWVMPSFRNALPRRYLWVGSISLYG